MITAVLVGNVNGRSISEYAQWIPFHVLPLLELATGADIDTSWLEFRDCDGGLVQRLHLDRRVVSYSDGHETIDETGRGYTGIFLTKTLQSPLIGTTLMTILLRHLVRVGINSNIEEKMIHLFQMIDALCGYYHLSSVNLLQSLDSSQTKKVKDALNEAARKIENLIPAAQHAGDTDQVHSLVSIAFRSKSVPTSTDTKLKTAVPALLLLPQFQFPDAMVLDADFATNPRSDNVHTWGDLLSKYRNTVIHDGYLDIKDQEDFDNAYRFLIHFHDLMIRIVLKMLGYTDDYESPSSEWHGMKKVDWVTGSTKPTELGYR